MAWEDSSFFGYDVITGDAPMDEISISLKKIAHEYNERFDRNPTVAEILYAFNIVMISSDNETIKDPENLQNMIIKLENQCHDQ